MVFSGSWWFLVVLGGFWWFLVVLGAFWLFLVVLGGYWEDALLEKLSKYQNYCSSQLHLKSRKLLHFPHNGPFKQKNIEKYILGWIGKPLVQAMLVTEVLSSSYSYPIYIENPLYGRQSIS